MTMERMQAKWGGGELLKRAVRGMLPKNRLRDERLARLKCESAVSGQCYVETMHADAAEIGFEGPYHPYKQNILKLRHEVSITHLPEVTATLEQAAAPPSAPQ